MREIKVIVEGMPFRVLFDEKGRPAMVSGGIWEGNERMTRLAIDKAWMYAEDAARTKRSTETKQKLAREHWSGKWLKKAWKPGLGAERLAALARRMHAKKYPKIKATKRKEISEHRAREYLKTIQKKSA